MYFHIERAMPLMLRAATPTFFGAGPPALFPTLMVTVSGSGDVMGDGTSGDTVMVSLAGSGDVRDIHVSGAGSVSVGGSGAVRLTEDDPSKVTTSVAGSGDIHVSKK